MPVEMLVEMKKTSKQKNPSPSRPKKERTDEEKALLHTQKQERARVARSKIDSSTSPTVQGLLKKKKALQWVYRWGWSTSKVLDIVGGSSRSGLAARLVSSGFLLATKTIAGGYSGGPTALLTLTEIGVNEVEKYIENESDLLDYELNPYKIDQEKIRHGEMAQRSTARMLLIGSISDYVTEKMGAVKSEKSQKQHDIIWIKENGAKQGVEIELTAKYSRKLDEFVDSCVDSITGKKVNEILIATDSKAIESRYSKAFKVGASYGVWEKNKNGFKVQTGYKNVPKTIDGKITCIVVKE